ncbi:MAG: acyl-CoA desaturase, partial [Candidatus Binatia bacterium]
MDTTPHFQSDAPTRLAPRLVTLVRWFDSWAGRKAGREYKPLQVDWVRCLPFVFMHVMCFAIFWVGWSWSAVMVAAALYVIRMFAITGFYHRYFSHRAFKTSRWFQFAGAALGAASIQRGPLWWAAHHRRHHATSDQAEDTHSPRQHGFLWSHMGWFTAEVNFATNLRAVPDLVKFPELCFLDRFDIIVPLLLAAFLYGCGAALATLAPGLETSGVQMLIWGFFVSTVVLY